MRARFTDKAAPAVALIAATLLLGACAAEEDEPTRPAAEGSETASCHKDHLPLHEEGVLTIATDKPAFEPWFVDNDPTNGKGFESAVAYALAEEMGFTEDEVEWVVEPFNKSYAPGPKDYDFDINQISITEKREQAVDFSEGYYDVNQALVAKKGTPIADANSLDAVADYRLGAQVGTTSYAYITQYVQPGEQPFTYDTTNDAKSALNAGQIDGIVVDLPTAFYISAVEIPGSAVVGQFPTQGETEQFGLLFEEGNPLVDCVDEALARLRDDGTLADIQDRWLSQAVRAPVLE
ncbi:MAG TPA: ABC transporter substrate-binding protein [Actinomycetota bacterium]|nr:ABC transporter substrate-binding protein [Actinomycetota bacterium]